MFPLVLYQEIHGKAPTEADLVALLNRLPRNLFLSLLTALACLACYGVNLASRGGQLKLLDLLGYETNCGAFQVIRSRLVTEHVAFINISALAALAACVCVYGSESLDKWPEHPQRFVIDGLLMANEFVHDYGDKPTIDDLAISEVRGLTENPEPIQDALYRYSLLVDWQSTDERTPTLPKPLAEEFPNLVHLKYEDYAAASLATMAWIFDIYKKNLVKQTLETLNHDTWLRGVKDKQPMLEFIADNSQTVDEVKNLLGTGGIREVIRCWRKAFVPMPMLQITEKDYLFPFPFCAASALGKGLLFRLVAGYNRLYGKVEGGDLFFNYFGRFLEDYVDGLFRKSLQGNDARILRDIKYKSPKSSDNRFIDNIILEKKKAAFVEVVGKRFRLIDTVVNGDMNCLKQDLEDMIYSKAEQLAESIALFKAGKLEGVDPSSIKTIFAVIIVDEFPHIAALNKMVKDELTARKIDLPNLQIIEVNELEMLEMALLKGRAFASILKKKCQHPETADMSMKNYAILKEPLLRQGRLPEVIAASEAWHEMVVARTKAWGLGEPTA